MFAKINKMEESKNYFIKCLEIDSNKVERDSQGLITKEQYINNLKDAAIKVGIKL
jgi:hypothetical protein